MWKYDGCDEVTRKEEKEQGGRVTGECMKIGAVEPSPLAVAAAAAQPPPQPPERRPVHGDSEASWRPAASSVPLSAAAAPPPFQSPRPSMSNGDVHGCRARWG